MSSLFRSAFSDYLPLIDIHDFYTIFVQIRKYDISTFYLKLDISKSNKIYDTKNVEHLYKPEIIELVRLFTNVFGDRKYLINDM